MFFCWLGPNKKGTNTLSFLELGVFPAAAGPEETNCAITLLRLYGDQYHHFQLDRLGSLGVFFRLIRIPHEE